MKEQGLFNTQILEKENSNKLKEKLTSLSVFEN
jgi:hypothetical protein